MFSWWVCLSVSPITMYFIASCLLFFRDFTETLRVYYYSLWANFDNYYITAYYGVCHGGIMFSSFRPSIHLPFECPSIYLSIYQLKFCVEFVRFAHISEGLHLKELVICGLYNYWKNTCQVTWFLLLLQIKGQGHTLRNYYPHAF